jgi:prevent-host-death family protein
MRSIPAARFKAQCLRIMDEVKAHREPVLITKKGKPVARLVPAEDPPRDVFGCLAGELVIAGDIRSPVAPLSTWEGLH